MKERKKRMSRIKKLRGGIYQRPEDTPAGPAGWYADIYWIERWGKRWLNKAKHFGPFAHREEMETIFNPEWERIYDLSYKPTNY